MIAKHQHTVVVIGNGMVGHRFIEKLVEADEEHNWRIVTFCEEPRAAYDRVGLTSFFAHRDAEKLMLARLDWYREHNIDLHIGDRATRIDRDRRIVVSEEGVTTRFDAVVLATGSYPFVPPVKGIQRPGVFVYRTIEDLQKIIEHGKQAKKCAVIGGGLLGLEAAKAAYDLGLETHVIEFAPRLMPRQIDDAGSRVLVNKIEALGVQVHLNKTTKEVRGNMGVEQLVFQDGQTLDVDMLIVSCGIRPRDELARECGLEIGERGGVAVNDRLQTSDPDIYAVGEVALHAGTIYGLVAPGYQMAEVVAYDLTRGKRDRESFSFDNRDAGESASDEKDSRPLFRGTDLSTKLKLMGVDVANFGEHEAPPETTVPLVFEDPFAGVYKKLLFDCEGTRLIGGVLVGDASDYGMLAALAKGENPLPCSPAELIGAAGPAASLGGDAVGDDAQVCSCNNVSKGAICAAIRGRNLTSVADVKSHTKAGTGCGGCLPLVTDIFKAEMAKAGVAISNHLCEHFAYSRQELFEIIKIKGIRTFSEVLASHGRGHGCEICKPTVASILASLWNDHILKPEHQTLQDTNDRFLANIQRGGLYSVVPRVLGGEITPEKLMTLGRVAKKYGLYTKITGGQRVDLFGAQLQQLPDIWEELVDAGFESGHAYGKSVRTVKSCVGSTWCRYGVQDSVGLAIRIEQRYRGIRAPHKIKLAVSGCVRECAEAQCKDLGLVATENGYNLYVCGNGGAKPRHADLLAADIDERTAIKYIDRFLMYYIYTADKLTRTAVWLEKLEGGIDHLRQVVIDDKLGICEELETRMQHLVDTYRCEWKEVVNDPERRKLFRQFINTDETESCIDLVDERGQVRPADWPKDVARTLYQIEMSQEQEDASGCRSQGSGPPQSTPALSGGATRVGARNDEPRESWVRVGSVQDFPRDGGAAVKYGKAQIAVFNYASRGEWYACQNMCPHMNAFVLSRGIIGTAGGVPKVACPLHKKPFSLDTGECLAEEDFAVKVFPVKINGDNVYLKLPPRRQLDTLLATERHVIREGSAESAAAACSACAAV